MHIPADSVFEQLLIERAAILFVPEEGDFPYSIIIKLPQTQIKEIQRGCKVRLGLYVHANEAKRILITFLEVFDDPLLPIVASFPQCKADSHQALLAALSRNLAPVFFYDESTRITAETTCHFSDTNNATSMLGDIGQLYSGKEDDDVNTALDILLEQLESRSTPLVDIAGIVTLEFCFDKFHIPNISVIGLKQGFSFSVADKDEGAAQEVSVWHKLEFMFLGNIYRPAWWLDNGIKKELTDIFAFTETDIFIIESKAVSVLNKEPNRSTQRREQDVLKDIKKGLRQVIGAARRVLANTPIYASTYSEANAELIFNRSVNLHAIIVVSDLSLIFKGRHAITQEIIDQSQKHHISIQVLDLAELNYIATRITDRGLFGQCLIHRFQAIVDNRNAFVKMEIT